MLSRTVARIGVRSMGVRAFSVETALTLPAVDGLKAGALTPTRHTQKRLRIYKVADSVTQSAPPNPHWAIDFGNRDKWLNPLMGWTSSRDTDYQMHERLQFKKKEDAVGFCETQGYEFFVEEGQKKRSFQGKKNYSDKYAWKGEPTE